MRGKEKRRNLVQGAILVRPAFPLALVALALVASPAVAIINGAQVAGALLGADRLPALVVEAHALSYGASGWFATEEGAFRATEIVDRGNNYWCIAGVFVGPPAWSLVFVGDYGNGATTRDLYGVISGTGPLLAGSCTAAPLTVNRVANAGDVVVFR